ncbi:fused MFS/spermidine synthase [filamentous cyanobacterium LEGE 11480]|uniref:Fused MFS/spermidine synthase n=1 Tax=Romeriopsis navalis LEGE 11480 TaxID=2777977 RepID=A0A928Z6P0_9CYAN|nr:fused MFS/spermidine synthase [Romeriopsis navalis]MBE9032405.1 fused MFS/spermidine synthase [Romeriopsis navalis LEGE 11480]
MTFLFATAVTLSAFLLFWVELFFAKLLLPHFGGGAHIWTTCLAAFQVFLLIGYGYAWAIAKLPLIRQAIIHGILLIAAIATMPIDLKVWQATDIPSLQIFCTLLFSIGLPLVQLSTTSSVLQNWYGRASKRNPYFLYALSNAGSLLALIAYPAGFEPHLNITQQSALWSGGFIVSAILTASAMFISSRRKQYAKATISTTVLDADTQAIQYPALTPWVMFQCFLCAFIPSSLLSGVTSYITSEIAPNPIVWALFLGLYLVTLILTFLPRPLLLPRDVGNPLLLFILVFLGLEVYGLGRFDRDALLGNIVFFLLLSWFYHSRLATLKPAPAKLGQFYFIMVLGGASGALFNAVIAPIVFVRMSEYHIVLALASPVLLSLQAFDQNWRWLPAEMTNLIKRYARMIVIGICICLSVVYTFPALASLDNFQTERAARSFYASYLVGYNQNSRFLIHGRTLHGRESLDENDRTPGSYYHPGGPVSNVFDTLPDNAAVAVVGLGVGEIGSYAKPQQDWTFLEIDPLVVDIAQTNFHHLRKMPHPPQIIVGDGRLKFQETQQQFDLIVLDAFNSDAVPIHLMTQEALQDVFLPHLKPNGILVYNITNTFVDLEPIVQQLAQATDMPALTRFVHEVKPEFRQTANHWVALTQNPQTLLQLRLNQWHDLKSGKTLWTDNFSSIRAAMKRK